MKTLNDEKKISNVLAEYKVKCKCGHSIVMTNNITKTLCTWCNHYVYKNAKEEFKDKMRIAILKQNKSALHQER